MPLRVPREPGNREPHDLRHRASTATGSPRSEAAAVGPPAVQASPAADGEPLRRLGPLGSVLITGTIIGALETLLAVSFGGLLFSGALAPHAGAGIGMALFGGMAVMLIIALRSALPGTIGSVQDVTAAAMVVVAAGVVARFETGDPRIVGTVIVAIVVTTASTGILLWTLGVLRLGQLARYVPFPVIGGFLAGTGWLLFVGGLGLLGGGDAGLTRVTTWLDPSFLSHTLPGVGLGVLLLIGTRRGAGTGFVPLTCVIGTAVFYAVVLAGPGIARVEQQGWLLGPFPSGALWPPDLALLTAVDVGILASQWSGMLTVAMLAAVALLLNASGIEFGSSVPAELDHELRVAGAANLVAAAGGGLPGFHALSLSNLAHRAGANARRTGLVAAALVGVTLILSGDLAGRLPRFVVGGLLIFLGLAFLTEWLVDGWRRMLRADYLVVALILLIIATVGFLEGVAVGIVVTVVLFLVTYSRADVVRHVVGGDAYPSQVDRPPSETARLRERSSSILVLQLQGFLFFGTSSRMLARIQRHLDDHGHVRYLVLDLRHVTGVDSSAVMSFRRAAQLAASHEVSIVMTGLSGRVAEQLERRPPDALTDVRFEPELDRAIQWCEDRLLADQPDGPAPGRRSLRAQLAADLQSSRAADLVLRELEQETLPAGHVLVEQGERSRELFFLVSGKLSVILVGADGETRRLRTMMPGNVVGEIGMYVEGPRSARVVTDTVCVIGRLTPEAVARLEADAPDAAAALHRLLARKLAERLATTLRTISALGG